MDTKAQLSLDSIVRVVTDQVSCELSGEVVILSLRNGEYYGLNEVAAAAWEQLQEPKSVARLRDEMMIRFSGVTAEQCATELLSLISDLLELELVTVDSGQNPPG